MATPEVTNASTSGGVYLTQAASGSAETSMLQIQLLIAQDFDEQISQFDQQLDLLSRAKDKMRDRLSTMSRFLAMPVDNSRKDQQAVMWVSPDQLGEFMGALETTDVDLGNLEMKDTPLMITDRGDDHFFDEMSKEQIWNESAGYAHGDNAKPGTKSAEIQSQGGDKNKNRDMYNPELAQTGGENVNTQQQDYSGQGPAIENFGGVSSAGSWGGVINDIAAMDDPGVAMAMAENFPNIGKKGEKGGSLPFFFDKGNKNSKDSNGRPVFCLLRSSVEEFKTQLSSKLSSLEEKSEKLTNQLQQIMKQREQAMNSASQTVKKQEEIKSNVLNKLST